MRFSTGLIALIGLGLSASALGQSASSSASSSPTLGQWMNTVELFVTMPVEADGAFVFSSAPAVEIEVDPGKVLDNTAYGFQGTYALQKNEMGFMFDMYNMNVDGQESLIKGVLLNGQPAPSDLVLGGKMDISGWMYSLVGTYQVNTAPLRPIYVYAGMKYLDLTTDFDWEATEYASTPPLVTAGKIKDDTTSWDGIVGLRGEAILRNGWFVPYGAEIGTGDSDVTWQAYLGAGYRYKWGNISARYRYVAYQFQEDEYALNDFKLGDAMLGVTLRF
jgi:hypothetical protein